MTDQHPPESAHARRDYEQLLEACREAGLLVGRTWDGYKVVFKAASEGVREPVAAIRHRMEMLLSEIESQLAIKELRIERLSDELSAAQARVELAERELARVRVPVHLPEDPK